MAGWLFWPVSITVGFVSGMVALFAPCCLTVLLPTYLAQIVQTRLRVVMATMVFALGIATVMLPVALGFRAAVSLFNNYHPYVYAVSALIMILAGLLLIGQFKLPMWIAPTQLRGRATFSSLYVLGITSGLASACCAPVLIGAITLTATVPSFLLALLVGVSYVFGMVAPLLAGALLSRSNWLSAMRRWINQPVAKTTRGSLIGGGTMIFYGIYLFLLTLSGRLNVAKTSPGYLRISSLIGRDVNKFLSEHPVLVITALVGLIWLVVIIYKSLKMEIKKGETYDVR
jgi:cytochrome c biogenesis protein CcdA